MRIPVPGDAAGLEPGKRQRRPQIAATVVVIIGLVLGIAGCGSRPAPPRPGPDAPASSTASAGNLQRGGDLQQGGDLPGWKQVFEEDFSAGDVPLGAFPGDRYSMRWSAGYPDGTPDTAGQFSGGRSGYYPSKVLSVQDGVLDWYLHSENGISMGAAPQPRIPRATAGQPQGNGLLYGRYAARFRADSLAGFKAVWRLWPASGAWPREGGIGLPEGGLANTIQGGVHYAGPDGSAASDIHGSTLDFASWHVAAVEWTPDRVDFFLDGRSIGTSTEALPATPMHLILQVESCLPECPLPDAAGHIYLDWISIWSPA